MNSAQKLRFFRHLVQLGFKEIEIAYPAASETDFGFVRQLIDDGEIPDDVWIQASPMALWRSYLADGNRFLRPPGLT